MAVWRKLKKLGAMRLHDAAWALPVTPITLEHLRWLVAEIQEGQGQATLWHAPGDTLADETQLVEYFLTESP